MMNDLTDRKSRRLPAEWELPCAILMAFPHADTDWAYMLDEVVDCYRHIISAIVEDSPVLLLTHDAKLTRQLLGDIADKVRMVQIKTNDTWARDFGPITVLEDGLPVPLDFKFNGWGLKFPADKDNLINAKLATAGIFRDGIENHLGFVLEGGSIDSDGQGTLLTTAKCLLSLNRNGGMNPEQIANYISESLGADRILWLVSGYLAGDDTDSHIDTLARFAPGDTILYVKCDDPGDEHFEQLQQMEAQLQEFPTAEGLPYNLIGLPMAKPVYCDGERLPATYANFLVTPTSVFMPTYADPRTDDLAMQTIKIAFPDHKIVGVDCRALIKQHGSLHCITMQLPLDVLSIDLPR